MEGIILDDCIRYLMEAQYHINQYEEIDLCSEIFEASDPEIAEKINKNKKAEVGAKGGLAKAIQSLKDMLNNIILAIKNFISSRKIKSSQRAALEKYKRTVSSNPGLKNKKINCLNIDEFYSEGEKIINEANSIDAKLARGENVDTNDIMSKISKYCSGAAAGLVVPVGIELALQTASSSTEIANNMLKALNMDAKLYQDIENAIGKSGAKSFKRDLTAMGKRISLRHKILEMRGYQSSSVSKAVEKTVDNVNKCIDGIAGVANTMTSDPDDNVKRTAVGDALHTASYIAKNRKELTDDIKKTGNIGKNIIRNKEIQGTIKTGINFANMSRKNAKELYKDDVKRDKLKKKIEKENKKYTKNVKKNISNQSMRDAVFGVNDPNSAYHKNKLVRQIADSKLI